MLNNKGILSKLSSVSCFIIALFILTAPLFQGTSWGQSCWTHTPYLLSYACSGFPHSCTEDYGTPMPQDPCKMVSSGIQSCVQSTHTPVNNQIFELSGCAIGCNSVSRCKATIFSGTGSYVTIEFCSVITNTTLCN